jgi:hypothetical protein
LFAEPAQDQLAVGVPRISEVVAQREQLDLEAQEYQGRCTGRVYNTAHPGAARGAHIRITVTERLKQLSEYQMFMAVATFITLVVTGFYGARSSK